MDMDDEDLYLYGDESTTTQTETNVTKHIVEEYQKPIETTDSYEPPIQDSNNVKEETVTESQAEQETDKQTNQEIEAEIETEDSEQDDEESDDDIEFVLDVNQDGDKPKEEEALVNLKPEQTKTSDAETAKAPAIDINVTGTLNGESILDVDLDGLEEQPWRKPGADITDYFNYGFNEFTWRAYCNKQKSMREDLKKNKGVNHIDQPNGIPINSMDIPFLKGPMDPSMPFIPPPGAPPFPPMPMLPPGVRPPIFLPPNRPHFDPSHNSQLNKHGVNNGRDTRDNDRSPMRPPSHPRPSNRESAKSNSPGSSRDPRLSNRDRNWDGNRDRARDRDNQRDRERDRDSHGHRERERERDRSINTRSERGRGGRGRDFEGDRSNRRRDSPEGLTTRDSRKRQVDELSDRSYKRR